MMIRREITPFLVRMFDQYPVVHRNRTSSVPARRRSAVQLSRVSSTSIWKRRTSVISRRLTPGGFSRNSATGRYSTRSSAFPNSFPICRSWSTRPAETDNSCSPEANSSNCPNQSASRLRDERRCCGCCRLAWLNGVGRERTIRSMIYCFSGCYPRIHDQGLDPSQALGDYFETYIERDVRRIGDIRNLASFQRFVRLCAGRVGQLVNLSSLGADAGVSHTTVRQWLTILEASYIVFQLSPYHANIRKRLVKSAKLYFYDVGLASFLLGIEHAGQLSTHPLRGALFENTVVAEILKHRLKPRQKTQPVILSRTFAVWSATCCTGSATGSAPSKSRPVQRLIPTISTR